PLQRVVAVHFCRVGPVRTERTIINFAVWQIGHRRQVEQTRIVGIMATSSTVGRIGVRKARVVSREFAVGVSDGPDPFGTLLLQAELRAVITANGSPDARALSAERPTTRAREQIPLTNVRGAPWRVTARLA